ncbi:MAG: DUF120 domain-containing protein [Candidatus Aenigmarchaeota archaeon]|nr:DUF120 domain-containing protein [Candidatus Aenigmarchaeota archaeon]
MISGKIVSGLGKGAYFVKMYEKLFLDSLGFVPFHGTLNLEVKKIPELKNPITIMPSGVRIDAEGVKQLQPVHCYMAKFNGEQTDALRRPFIQAAVVRPVATRHPENIIEIIAPICIKDFYGLKDGDKFACSLA